MEVNARINYPIKNALRDMEQRGVIDMELECTKFYVSSVSLRVASVGITFGELECYHESFLFYSRSPGGGGYSKTFWTGRLRPEVQPLSL